MEHLTRSEIFLSLGLWRLGDVKCHFVPRHGMDLGVLRLKPHIHAHANVLAHFTPYGMGNLPTTLCFLASSVTNNSHHFITVYL